MRQHPGFQSASTASWYSWYARFKSRAVPNPENAWPLPAVLPSGTSRPRDSSAAPLVLYTDPVCAVKVQISKHEKAPQHCLPLAILRYFHIASVEGSRFSASSPSRCSVHKYMAACRGQRLQLLPVARELVRCRLNLGSGIAHMVQVAEPELGGRVRSRTRNQSTLSRRFDGTP